MSSAMAKADIEIERVLWVAYFTHDEAVGKGMFVPSEPWTYELFLNYRKSFAKVGYVVPFGKADGRRPLTPEIVYFERGKTWPKGPKWLRFFLELPSAIAAIHTAARDVRPQVVQVFGPNLAALLVWMTPSLWRVPKMCFIEAFWETILPFQDYIPRPIRRFLPIWYRLVYRSFDGYCGAPSLDPEFYARRGMQKGKIFPWVQAIDVDVIGELSASDAVPGVLEAKEPRIVTVGRLHPEKLSLDVLDTFLELARGGFAGSMVFVGDGPLREEIEARARQAGLGNRVVVTGALPYPDAQRAVKACDYYLATMQGSALLEAMAAALPIVAYDHETHAAMLRHDETGILVPNRDVRAAAAAIADLVREPERAARLGAAASADVRSRYDPSTVARILSEPLRAVARGQRAERKDD